MGGLVVAAICVVVVVKIKNAQARKEAIRKAGQLTCVREIMSCLVAQVYATDGGQRKHAFEVWRALGYEECNLRGFRITEADIDAAGKPTCKIRFILFRRQDDARRGTIEEWTSVRPKYVVAIRGTKPRCQQDIVDDIRHACEILHSSPAYDILLRMTNSVIDQCVILNEDHFDDKMICVTGHSLGAAFGLLVARQLELGGRRVQAHLFNPPFLTLEIIGRKAVAGLQVQDIFRFVGDIVREALAKTPTRDPDQLERVSREMEHEYCRLGDWTPNLYVNEHDTICNHYIKYFSGNTPQCSSSQTRFLQEHGVDARASHLIPSAVLHTNSRNVHSKPRSYYFCHKNNQWFKHPLQGYSQQAYYLLG